MRDRFLNGLVAAAVASLALLPMTSWGQALPAATTAVQCATVVDGVATHVNDPSRCSLPGAQAALTLSPVAGATLHAEYGGGINSSAQANASIKYYFQIIGGSVGDAVPLLIATELATAVSAPDGGSASASLFVHSSAGAIPDRQIVVCSNGSCGASGPTFSGTLATTGFSGDDGDFIVLDLIAGVGDSFGARSADASADPWIYIDPAFAGASRYRIAVSDGVANAISAVPEPSTFALLALGLGALARRRSHRLRGVSEA
jgi:hypothetical protein